MHFVILFFICSIIYNNCESYQDYGYQDENEAAWKCTEPSAEYPDYFNCVGYKIPRFVGERLIEGKALCLEEVILNEKPYYYCATKFPLLEG